MLVVFSDPQHDIEAVSFLAEFSQPSKLPAGNPVTPELYEQIGRLKMELEWVKKKAAAFG